MWSNKRSGAAQAARPEPKNSQADQQPQSPPAPPEGSTEMRKEARLGPNLRVKGEISGNEDLVIDGSVEGLIQLDEQKLTIGRTGKVTADIIAGEVVVGGNVKGNVRAKGRIEIILVPGVGVVFPCS